MNKSCTDKSTMVYTSKEDKDRYQGFWFTLRRSSHRGCSVKKVFLEILPNSQENTCARDPFLIKLQVSAQLFFCEFCKISKNIFFTEHPQTLRTYYYSQFPFYVNLMVNVERFIYQVTLLLSLKSTPLLLFRKLSLSYFAKINILLPYKLFR